MYGRYDSVGLKVLKTVQKKAQIVEQLWRGSQWQHVGLTVQRPLIPDRPLALLAVAFDADGDRRGRFQGVSASHEMIMGLY